MEGVERRRGGHAYLHRLMQRVDMDRGCSYSRNTHRGAARAGIHGFGALSYVVGRAQRYDSLGKILRWHFLALAGAAARTAQHKRGAFHWAIPGMESPAVQEQAAREETKTCDGLALFDTTISGAASEIIRHREGTGIGDEAAESGLK
jgi:hypothetical protein